MPIAAGRLAISSGGAGDFGGGGGRTVGPVIFPVGSGVWSSGLIESGQNEGDGKSKGG